MVLLGKNYHDREDFFTTKNTKRTKKKSLCSLACGWAGFVPFVVQFWLRPKPRYELAGALINLQQIQFRPQQDNENGAFGQDKYQKIALDFSEKFVYLLTHFDRMDIAGYTYHCIEGRLRKILELGLTDHSLA